MGFDGLFIGRLDYQDKMIRLLNKTPEMIWQSSANLGKILISMIISLFAAIFAIIVPKAYNNNFLLSHSYTHRKL